MSGNERLAPTDNRSNTVRVCVSLKKRIENMGRQRITYKTVLEAVAKKQYWFVEWKNIKRKDRTVVHLKDFRKALHFQDVTSSERKVIELWNLMFDLDFFKKVNNTPDTAFAQLYEIALSLGYTDNIYKNTERTQIQEEQTSSVTRGD